MFGFGSSEMTLTSSSNSNGETYTNPKNIGITMTAIIGFGISNCMDYNSRIFLPSNESTCLLCLLQRKLPTN